MKALIAETLPAVGAATAADTPITITFVPGIAGGAVSRTQTYPGNHPNHGDPTHRPALPQELATMR